jgi:hypothetical protein
MVNLSQDPHFVGDMLRAATIPRIMDYLKENTSQCPPRLLVSYATPFLGLEHLNKG